MAKKFELGSALADVLGGVPKTDTAAEQIVMLPLASIDADEKNFYSIEGIDALAANIELVGLMDPLRVRENPYMPGRYLIVSGHRRRAALWTLYEENPEKWGKAPCIVEPPAESPEMQELRLIYANADTRVLSDADQSAQAERVEMLLYKLSEQGVSFPGRMREHVAEACKTSSTKIAEWKAIREKLIPELRQRWEAGEINHSVAYGLQKLPETAQRAIEASAKRTGAGFIKGWGVDYCAENAERLTVERKCPDDGSACVQDGRRFVQILRDPCSWTRCRGGCCVSCHQLDECGFPCAKGKAQKEKNKADRKAEREKLEAKSKKETEKRQAGFRKARQAQAKRILPLIAQAGLGDGETLPGRYSYETVKVEKIRKAAAGDFGDDYYYDGDLIPTDAGQLAKMADLLGCSMDYLAGRSNVPTPGAPAPQELISVDERYPAEGEYVIAYTRALVAIPSVYFRAAFMDCTEKSVANNRLAGIEYWSPRPQLPEGKKWPGQEIIEGMVRK